MKKHLKTNYKIGGMMLLIIALAVLFPTTSNASLQSRPNATSLVSKTASEFFRLCREMETSSGPLGLDATISLEADKVTETSPSNGIDVHMIKNTEYGTAAILAASAYGNCPSGSSSSASTTQNKSGIMQMAGGQWEYVAGILDPTQITNSTAKTDYLKYIIAADGRYKDIYTSTTAADAYKPGDATYETQKWKGASHANFVSAGDPVFRRSYGGVFDYYYNGGGAGSFVGSRAAVVSCAGL